MDYYPRIFYEDGTIISYPYGVYIYYQGTPFPYTPSMIKKNIITRPNGQSYLISSNGRLHGINIAKIQRVFARSIHDSNIYIYDPNYFNGHEDTETVFDPRSRDTKYTDVGWCSHPLFFSRTIGGKKESIEQYSFPVITGYDQDRPLTPSPPSAIVQEQQYKRRSRKSRNKKDGRVKRKCAECKLRKNCIAEKFIGKPYTCPSCVQKLKFDSTTTSVKK